MMRVQQRQTLVKVAGSADRLEDEAMNQDVYVLRITEGEEAGRGDTGQLS